MLHIIMVYISELGTSCSEEPQKSRFENNCFSDSKQENYVGFKSHAGKKKTFFLSFFNNFTECSRIILIKFINEKITNSYNTYSLSERAGSRSYSYCATMSVIYILYRVYCIIYTYLVQPFNYSQLVLGFPNSFRIT